MNSLRLFLSLFLISLALDLRSQNLDEILRIGIENNPGLKAKYLEFEASMQKVSQANSLPDPQFSFGYFVSPVETRVGPQKARFNLTQMFPWFGTLSAAGDVFTLQAEAKYQEFINARNELSFKIKAAWYPIYEVNKVLELQQENIEILKTFQELATTSFKNGLGSMVDVIRVEIMIENTQTDINLLKEKRIPLLAALNRLLNRNELTEVLTPESFERADIEMAYRKENLISDNPILFSYDLQIESAIKREKLAKRQGMPKIGLGLDYIVIDKNDLNMPDNGKDAIMPMVSLSLPLYRGKYKSAVKEARIMQESIAANRMEYENSLTSNYAMSWYELQKADELLNLYEAQLEKTRQVLDLLLTSYSNSGKDFVEILRIQQEILKYEIAEANTTKDYFTALARLDFITSKSE